jgi:transposase
MSQNKKPYYSLEFKQDATKLVLSKGYSIPEAATNLGVSESALRKWIRVEKGGSPNTTNLSGSPLSLSEHEELLRLRKENARLRMEREILKKASAFFAQEMK